MAFRDETEALRARIEILERDLSDAEARAAENDDAQRELIVLRARVADLEKRVAKSSSSRSPLALKRMALGVGATLACFVVGVVLYSGYDSINVDAAPTRGMLDLDEHPSPPPLSSTTVGEHDADSLGSGCPGYLPSAPQLVLRTAQTTTVSLWTQGTEDLVLLVRSDTGETVCDDDSGLNFNARVAAELGPGEHRVWVGTYREDVRADFALHVETAVDLDDAGLFADADPTLGSLHPDQPLWGRTLHGSTTGEVPATRGRPGCAGNVPLTPHVRLHLDEPHDVRVGAHSANDLVLLLERADGSFVCDDDGGEDLDPRLDERLSAGAHTLWVGSYQVAEDAQFDLTIEGTRAALTADGDSQPPRLGSWDLSAEPLLSFSGLVAPAIPVTSTSTSCRSGWGLGGRDLELSLEEPSDVSLELVSEGDMWLLIEHPDGTWSCTTRGGLPPRAFAAGVHRVSLVVPASASRTPFTLTAHAHTE